METTKQQILDKLDENETIILYANKHAKVLFKTIRRMIENLQSFDDLLEIYKDFRDSDISEGEESANILAFLYYIKKGNLEGKSFNPHYYLNTEKDPLAERMKELECMYTKMKNCKHYDNGHGNGNYLPGACCGPPNCNKTKEYIIPKCNGIINRCDLT
jgi:hypothetical protein